MPTPPPELEVASLADELKLPLPICRLLLARGHRAPDTARQFLRPRLDQLHDPLTMDGLPEAVHRLQSAIRNEEVILIHGDYDVDGMCSTALLTRTIRTLGGRAVPFIPRRLVDGYDLGSAGVEAAASAGATVVVTCDCGTSALEPIAALCAQGVDVIVSDHHLPGGPLPECVAVLNPRRPGSRYPDADLAAVGVAFKLALALTRALGGNENAVYRMLDLVALATIADIAPLRGENRVFARYGLRMLAQTENVGLRALLRASGLDGKTVTAGRVGFILAPRLNAVGRLGHALRGVELLLAENEHDANVIARELEELNRDRQALDQRTLDEARQMVDALELESTYGIVLASDRWHAGVIGIVASRIVEDTGRPALLIALDGNEGKGSGRSISAFDLHAALGECRESLIRFGGHRAAAGITIERARVPDFAARFNDVARERLTADDLVREIRIDMEVGIDGGLAELETLLRHFEPFGMGNPAPVLAARGVRLAGPPRVVGKDGLKLRLSMPGGEFEALGWGMGSLASNLDAALPLDLAFRLERDEYRGESRLQARLADVHQ